MSYSLLFYLYLYICLQDTAEAALVPAGFDRVELIEISTGLRGLAASFKSPADWDKLAADVNTGSSPTGVHATVTNISTDALSATSSASVEMESEDEWLTGLQNYIKQGTCLTQIMFQK
jgi:hypothetical protein